MDDELSQPTATVPEVTDPYSKLKDPVGTAEIAVRLGVAKDTVMTWGKRGILPAPTIEQTRTPVYRQRAWEWSTILRWAGDTGHILDEKAVAEYQVKFGKPPMAARKGGKLASGKPPKKRTPKAVTAGVVDPLRGARRKASSSFKPAAK